MERKWQVLADADGILDREEAQHAFIEAENILHRLGGVVSVVAARIEYDDGSFEPAGYLFRWESFSPARKRPQAEAEVEPEAELDELAAAA